MSRICAASRGRLSLTHLISCPIGTGNDDLDRMARRSTLETYSVVVTVVRENRLAFLDAIHWDGMLLNDFNGYGFWRREVPDLLALLVRILQELRDVCSSMIADGLAQLKVAGYHLRKARTKSTG